VYFNGTDKAKIFLLLVKRIHNCNIILALSEYIKKRKQKEKEEVVVVVVVQQLTFVMSWTNLHGNFEQLERSENILKECLPLNFIPTEFKEH